METLECKLADPVTFNPARDIDQVPSELADRLPDIPNMGNADEEQQFRRIEFQILEFDWIFRGNSAKMFIEELAQTPNDNVFTVTTVSTAIKFLWEFYQPEIIKKIYIPYMIYFFSFVLYASFIYGSAIGDWGLKYVFGVWCIGYSAYILYMETKQFIEQGSKYFTMPAFIWNALDIISSLLVVMFVLTDCLGFLFQPPETFLRIVASISVFLLWLKFFSFLRIFESFSAFIRMIIEMFKDMATFLSMLILGILSFANAFYILDRAKNDQGEAANISGKNFIDSVIYIYRTGLGDFATDDYNASKYSMILWTLFLLCTVFIQILLLNLLIAIMGDTFERVQEMKEQAQLREICALIADNWFLLDRESAFKTAKYIVVASLEKAAGSTAGAWDGKLAAIKAHFERSSKSIEANVQKVRDATKTEADGVFRKVEGQFMQSDQLQRGFNK